MYNDRNNEWLHEAQISLFKCIKQKRLIYSNRTVSWIGLLTALLEYIDLVLQANNNVNFSFFDHGTSQLYHVYLYDIIVINSHT